MSHLRSWVAISVHFRNFSTTIGTIEKLRLELIPKLGNRDLCHPRCVGMIASKLRIESNAWMGVTSPSDAARRSRAARVGISACRSTMHLADWSYHQFLRRDLTNTRVRANWACGGRNDRTMTSGGNAHGTSPLSFSAIGRGCRRAPSPLAHNQGGSLSIVTGAPDRRVCPRRRQRHCLAAYGQCLSDRLDQQFIVENRPARDTHPVPSSAAYETR